MLKRNAGTDFIIGERFLFGSVEFEPRNNHACHPEENNIRTRRQGAGWVPMLQLFGGFTRFAPADGGKAPEP